MIVREKENEKEYEYTNSFISTTYICISLRIAMLIYTQITADNSTATLQYVVINVKDS